MLIELMAELGADEANTLMIGDTVHDLHMAARAGVPAVAVSYGAHARADLASLAPLACLESIDELTQWLTRNG
jgi:phosphoglycolate phosphatase